MIYLYVKQHNVTGLKYFGKTEKEDPYKYKGSGKRWLKHIDRHGNNITTTHLWEFNNQEECTDFALQFSEENNIVKSREWANQRPENGLDGNPKGIVYGAEWESKFSKRDKTGEKNPFFRKTHTLEAIKNIREKNSIAQAGGRNPRAKKVLYNGTMYDTINDLCTALSISRYMASKLDLIYVKDDK